MSHLGRPLLYSRVEVPCSRRPTVAVLVHVAVVSDPHALDILRPPPQTTEPQVVDSRPLGHAVELGRGCTVAHAGGSACLEP